MPSPSSPPRVSIRLYRRSIHAFSNAILPSNPIGSFSWLLCCDRQTPAGLQGAAEAVAAVLLTSRLQLAVAVVAAADPVHCPVVCAPLLACLAGVKAVAAVAGRVDVLDQKNATQSRVARVASQLGLTAAFPAIETEMKAQAALLTSVVVAAAQLHSSQVALEIRAAARSQAEGASQAGLESRVAAAAQVAAAAFLAAWACQLGARLNAMRAAAVVAAWGPPAPSAALAAAAVGANRHRCHRCAAPRHRLAKSSKGRTPSPGHWRAAAAVVAVGVAAAFAQTLAAPPATGQMAVAAARVTRCCLQAVWAVTAIAMCAAALGAPAAAAQRQQRCYCLLPHCRRTLS
eukprot:364615-Chlamydomonas_euryale.AAC.15